MAPIFVFMDIILLNISEEPSFTQFVLQMIMLWLLEEGRRVEC